MSFYFLVFKGRKKERKFCPFSIFHSPLQSIYFRVFFLLRTFQTCYRYHSPSLTTALQLTVGYFQELIRASRLHTIIITRSNTSVKTSSLGNGGESEKKLFIFQAPNVLSNHFRKYCTWTLNHSVYKQTLIQVIFDVHFKMI